ncbi:MAG: hypothetical protein IPK27_19895 [Rhodanobacteraceae bacterium]|nr:hypothetical protein [Rhodanobacteraceae bacterium]
MYLSEHADNEAQPNPAGLTMNAMLRCIAVLGLGYSASALADCAPTECANVVLLELAVLENGDVAVVVTGNSGVVTACDASGNPNRVTAYLRPTHVGYARIYAGLLTAYYVQDPVRYQFQNTPGQPCTIRTFILD